MGYFRLLLASLVVVSHMGITLYGHNPGVFAVAIFYLLAGQVVVRLWLRMPGDNWLARGRDFYRDRLLRIAPMYVGMLCIGVLAWYLGAQSWFVSATPDIWAWLGNILIVPLNYYMYNGADQFTLLPPAWSLAAEIQFYLLVPLLLASARLLVPAFVMSLVVFFCAQQGWLNTDIFGYRLLPGVLFIFLSGGLLELHRNARLPRAGLWLVIGCWLAISLWAGWLLLNPSARAPYNLEVALGYALGLPVVQLLHLLRQRRRHASVSRPAWRTGSGQQLAGVLSYGVFLVHFPVLWLLELFRPGLAHSVPVVILLSMLLALLVHFALERPLWHRLRLILVTGAQ